MSEMFHTVEAAAERLSLHPKTVLRCIRDGRLRATRIGKSWRIRAGDLDAFAGGPASVPAAGQAPGARVTAIADLEGVSMDASQRLASALQASLIGVAARPRPLRLDTAYDPERQTLKVVMVGQVLDVAALLQTLHALQEAFR